MATLSKRRSRRLARTGGTGGGAMPTAPGAPTSVVATAGNTTAGLTWTAPASNGGSPITNYEITPYIGATPQAPILTGSTATSYTVTGLTNGTTYAFTVAAINLVGTGPFSAISNSVTPATVPGAPTSVVATAGNTTASLTWTAPASNGGAAITSYQVVPYIGASAQAPINTGSSSTSYTVTGLTNGTAYTFTVAATNSVGTGAASAASNSVTPHVPTPLSLVQTATTPEGSSNSNTLTPGSAVTSGNTLLVGIMLFGQSGGTDISNISSVTDNHGNTYTRITAADCSYGAAGLGWGQRGAWYYATGVASGSTTITATYNENAYNFITVWEITPAQFDQALVDNTQTGHGTITAPSITPSASGSFLACQGQYNNSTSNSSTASSGWVMSETASAGGGGNFAAYKTLGTPGAEAPTFTCTPGATVDHNTVEILSFIPV